MAVKLTKNELKVQKDRLKQFQRYLPTLQLKKQQLQSVVMHVTAQLEEVERQRRAAVDGLDDWVAVFAENDSFPAEKRLDMQIQVYDKIKDYKTVIPLYEESIRQSFSLSKRSHYLNKLSDAYLKLGRYDKSLEAMPRNCVK